MDTGLTNKKEILGHQERGKAGTKRRGKRTVEGATDIRESNPKKVRRAGNMIQMEQIGAMKSRGGGLNIDKVLEQTPIPQESNLTNPFPTSSSSE